MKKILLVDDKPENLYLLETLLTHNGFAVEKASNGEEALELARKNTPDMIVADVLMPVMDGFELCHKVKTDPLMNKAAFIFYTASYLDKRDEELALSLGVDRYLLKPQDPDVLLKVFNEVFDEYQEGKEDSVIPFPREKDYLREHNESLVRMLEKKIEQLNKTRLGLEVEVQVRKRTAEELKASLVEKDILLKELYHRTKNNLQVIVGLFDIQSRKMADKSIETVFKEMSNRIYSMSMVHDLLYRTNNLSELKLDLFLSKLATQLIALYETDRTEVSLELGIASIPVNLQLTVPLSLVINEIISNSLTYAFSGQAKGQITIKARRDGENGLVLIIGDDGAGLESNYSPLKSDSLGMHIIRTIVENQLSGELRIDSTEGLVYTLILPDMLAVD